MSVARGEGPARRRRASRRTSGPPAVAEVAERHGVPREAVLKFDQNTPPLPGVPQVPLAESMARLNEYPDGTYRELREAAASLRRSGARERRRRRGRRRPDPPARADVPRARRSGPRSIRRRTRCTGSRRRCTAPTWSGRGRTPICAGVCNPNNPTGERGSSRSRSSRSLARQPETIVVVDEAYVEYGARSAARRGSTSCRTSSSCERSRRRSGSPRFASASPLAHPDTAALLTERRAPAPISGPAAAIGAAALRSPRLGDVEATIAERERLAGRARRGGLRLRADGDELRLRPDGPGRSPSGSRRRESSCARSQRGSASPSAGRPRTTCCSAPSARSRGRRPDGEATVLRTTTETALRLTLALDGTGRTRVETGIGFLDHLLTLLAFHAGFDLELVAGGDLDVDEHHTVEDVHAALGTRSREALGDARRRRALRLRDRADGRGARDGRRRSRAAPARRDRALLLGRPRRRARRLAPRATRSSGSRSRRGAPCTSSPSGADDHHVAEAAYKALGQALRQAVAPGAAGIRSTKGAA